MIPPLFARLNRAADTLPRMFRNRSSWRLVRICPEPIEGQTSIGGNLYVCWRLLLTAEFSADVEPSFAAGIVDGNYGCGAAGEG